MTGKRALKKLDWPEGAYRWRGSVEGLRPGRRRVLSLELRDASGDLGALEAFADLRELVLDADRELDLSPLRGMRLEKVSVRAASGCDLAPVGDIEGLRALGLSAAGTVLVPSRWRLPRTLRELHVLAEGDPPSGAQQVVGSIDWTLLIGLEALTVVGDPDDPLHLDWGLLRQLPELRRLEARHGAWHAGSGPSPLEPPFEGLSRELQWIRIDAWDPDATRVALERYLGWPDGQPPTDSDPHAQWGLGVSQRYEPEGRQEPWAVLETDGWWHVYGSLVEWADAQGEDVETEEEAQRLAERLVREADRSLAGRVEFDGEGNGTGIAAQRREDLGRVLEILALPGSPDGGAR